MIIVNVAKDFSRYPTGRYMKSGNTSGEEFREKFLIPNFELGQVVRIELDGTIGYGSSFLEEAFGGLARKSKLSANEILKQLVLISEDATLIQEIEEYIKDASQS